MDGYDGGGGAGDDGGRRGRSKVHGGVRMRTQSETNHSVEDEQRVMDSLKKVLNRLDRNLESVASFLTLLLVEQYYS